MKRKKEISENKRNNARLYPLYKMFSWDLLCFYSIEFLFYTITKGVTASQAVIISAFYIFFRIVMQIPAVVISDLLGKRKGIIIGNILLLLYLGLLIRARGLIGIVIADIICSLGYDTKVISETNLLYDSVSTKGGEGLYLQLDSRGGSWYYWLDGFTCLSAGYLFVFNNYLPIIVCMGFVIISTILSFGFKDIYHVKHNKEKKTNVVLKEYMVDLRESVGFIIKSRRMKSYIIFGSVFYGLIKVIDVYRSALLVSKDIPEEQFSMIFALLSIMAAVAVTLSKKLQKKFRNRTLTFLSVLYIGACIIIGIITNIFNSYIAIPIIISMLVVIKVCSATWSILELKYLKNFTTEKVRNKIMFTYQLIVGIVASLMSLLSSLVLKKLGINYSFLTVSIIGLILILIVLKYMKPRFGLKPKEYRKEDINIEELIH